MLRRRGALLKRNWGREGERVRSVRERAARADRPRELVTGV